MTVVFKLGGSLLTLPDLGDRIRSIVACRSDQLCLVVVGGGAAADVVREWTQIHQLDDESSHWLAIRSLDLNRHLLETLLCWRSVSSLEDAFGQGKHDQSPLLLDVHSFAKHEEPREAERLPHNWNITSDSLAAWAAIRLAADELVMLKSISVPQRLTAQEASDRDMVDPHFPQLARQLQRISWCDLRASHPVIEPWLD
jgi:aspartokinase-like uncharacterized kinase